MSEQAYRRFMERYQRRMSNRRQPKQDAWMDEPVLGHSEEQLGVLGLPLPKPDHDLADIVLDLLASADPPLGPEAQTLARAGRGGDIAIGHLTPGEIVIPQRLQTPELMAALQRAAHAIGAPLARMQVGHPNNRINPKTGAPEFDDDEEENNSYLNQDPSAGDAGDFAGYEDQGSSGDAQGAGDGSVVGAGGTAPSEPGEGDQTPPPQQGPLRVDPATNEGITIQASRLPLTPDDQRLIQGIHMTEAADQYRDPRVFNAIGWTVINRLRNKNTPSIPAVVYQKQPGNPKMYQYNGVGTQRFQDALNGRFTGEDAKAFDASGISARGTLSGQIPDPTNGATNFYKGTPANPPPGFFANAIAAHHLVPTGPMIGPFTFLKEP